MFRITGLRVRGLFLLLSSLLIGYIEFYIPSITFDNLPIIVSIISLIIALGFALPFVQQLARVLKFCNLWLQEDGQDWEVTYLDVATPVPDYLLNASSEIEDLGLKKFGVKKVTAKGSTNRIWVWMDATRTIVAQLLETENQEPRVGFASEFLDGFSIETVYKWEITIRTDRVMLHNLDSSISETYNFHAHLYDEQIHEHGQAKTFVTLADTDPDVSQRKYEFRQFYITFIKRLLPVVLFFGTIISAFIATAVLLQIATTGIAFFTGTLILGLSFTLIDYQAVDESFQPINERKSRKTAEA